MALIIEDGSIVAGANSFVSDSQFSAWALLAGYVLPHTESERESALYKAFLFINQTYDNRLAGYRIDPVQTGIFPRSSVYAYGFLVPSNSIPEDIKLAQMSAAVSIGLGADTNSIKDSGDLSSFTVVGVYSETYSESGGTPTIPEMPAVTRYLSAYMKSSGGISLSKDNMGFLG